MLLVCELHNQRNQSILIVLKRSFKFNLNYFDKLDFSKVQFDKNIFI
jgi:hypothetical protein